MAPRYAVGARCNQFRSLKFHRVIPAKAGTSVGRNGDSRFRRNDIVVGSVIVPECIKLWEPLTGSDSRDTQSRVAFQGPVT
jgi:hypothetical protein